MEGLGETLPKRLLEQKYLNLAQHCLFLMGTVAKSYLVRRIVGGKFDEHEAR
jgi:hypothetical protein